MSDIFTYRRFEDPKVHYMSIMSPAREWLKRFIKEDMDQLNAELSGCRQITNALGSFSGRDRKPTPCLIGEGV